MLCYISRLLYIRSKCNLAITITGRYCTSTFGNHHSQKLTLQISTPITFYDSASFRVLAYIVHYGNRPSGIAYTDLRHFSRLTIYAFLSVYLFIWYTTAIVLLRLHIRISGTSHLTIYAFLCVYLSISVLMWKTGRRLPRIVADGGSTAVHVSTKKN